MARKSRGKKDRTRKGDKVRGNNEGTITLFFYHTPREDRHSYLDDEYAVNYMNTLISKFGRDQNLVFPDQVLILNNPDVTPDGEILAYLVIREPRGNVYSDVNVLLAKEDDSVEHEGRRELAEAGKSKNELVEEYVTSYLRGMGLEAMIIANSGLPLVNSLRRDYPKSYIVRTRYATPPELPERHREEVQ